MDKIVTCILVTFITLFFSSALVSKDCADCFDLKQVNKKEMLPRLPFNAVTSKIGVGYACESKSLDPAFHEAELKTIDGKSSEQVTKLLGGLSLTGDKKILESFEALITKEKGAVINIASLYPTTLTCKTPICAAKAIWGERVAPSMLLLHLKRGINTSNLRYADAEQLTESEMNTIYRAAELLPDFLFPVEKNLQLTRYTKGKQHPWVKMADTKYECTTALSIIILLDCWGNNNFADEKLGTVVHELAHKVSYAIDINEDPHWLELSGWVRKGESWEFPPSACFPSEYGKSNPREDFAESVVAYRMGGELFKKRCPKKYQFMKETLFLGQEFLNDKTCLAENHSVVNNILKNLKPATLPLSKNEVVDFLGASLLHIDSQYEEISKPIENMVKTLYYQPGLKRSHPKDRILAHSLSTRLPATDEKRSNFLNSTLNTARDALGDFLTIGIEKQCQLMNNETLDATNAKGYCAKWTSGFTNQMKFLNEELNVESVEIEKADYLNWYALKICYYALYKASVENKPISCEMFKLAVQSVMEANKKK